MSEHAMKSTFANARASLSDEQLKHVTGGARVNSRPEAPEDHLIDHVSLDLHGAAAADGYRIHHPRQPPPQDEEAPVTPMETIQFSGSVTVQNLETGSGIPITGIDRIVLWSDGYVVGYHNYFGGPGQSEGFYLGFDEGALRGHIVQEIIHDAAAQGDQIKVTDGFEDLPVPLPNNE